MRRTAIAIALAAVLLPATAARAQQRPLVTQDPETIGAGRILIEGGLDYGTDIFFRLSWEDASQNTEITDTLQFPDGCGVLMPLSGGDPPIDEMGSKDAPVNAWFWRADFKDGPRNTVARGLGTKRHLDFSTQAGG